MPELLPGVDPAELATIAFRRKDNPDRSLLTHNEDGVRGPVICVTWEELRYYVLLEHGYKIEPFETTKEHLGTICVANGFNGIHIFRIHEGKTYRRTERFR